MGQVQSQKGNSKALAAPGIRLPTSNLSLLKRETSEAARARPTWEAIPASGPGSESEGTARPWLLQE